MALGAREQYIRPPVVATESASPAAALWRFRLVAALLLLLMTVVVVMLFLHFSGVTAEDPGLGGALNPVRGL